MSQDFEKKTPRKSYALCPAKSEVGVKVVMCIEANRSFEHFVWKTFF